MPNIASHVELIKPAATGGIGSLFAGILMEYIGVSPPIFIAAAFGAVVAVAMLTRSVNMLFFGYSIPAAFVSVLIAFTGSIGACYTFHLIHPLIGLTLPQTPATMVLAFILVYFMPIILEVGKNRIEGFKK